MTDLMTVRCVRCGADPLAVSNEIGADYDDRLLNKAEGTYTIQLRMAERDLATAEAYALSLALSLGSNAETRKQNAVLYLAGRLDMAEEQKEAVDAYQQALGMVDHILHELTYIRKEQQSRRHERTEASTAALEHYGEVATVAVGLTPYPAIATAEAA